MYFSGFGNWEKGDYDDGFIMTYHGLVQGGGKPTRTLRVHMICDDQYTHQVSCKAVDTQYGPNEILYSIDVRSDIACGDSEPTTVFVGQIIGYVSCFLFVVRKKIKFEFLRKH